MRHVLEIARTGLVAVLLHPLRSLATTGSLVVILVPYLAGLGLSQGLQAEAEASIRFGADLYVTGSQFGRDVPVPLAAAERVRALDGVLAVTPRIVGTEAPTGWLNDASRMVAEFGPPRVPLERMIEWTANWVAHDRESLGKPTHYEVRDGRY